MANEQFWALPEHLAEETLRALNSPLHLSPPDTPTPGYSKVGGVAVIPVSGVITRDCRWMGATQEQIRTALLSAVGDASVRGILLCCNSPGGVVSGVKELADAIHDAGKKKPCAAYADGMCASAAYWLAASTGRVYAPVTAAVGSIGVIMTHADYSGLNEQYGVRVTSITSGKWKDAGDENRPMREEERAYFQQRLAALHGIFKADVSTRMRLAAPESAWGEAQVFLAEEARQAGLVTAIVQDVSAAIALLSKETRMDRQTLAAQHPELLAQIEAAARAEAVADAENQQKNTLALVQTIIGDQAYARVQQVFDVCAKAHISPQQMQALAPLLLTPAAQQAGTQPGAQPPVQADPEKAAMQAILSALQTTAASPLPANPAAPNAPAKSPLVADAERRAARA